MCERENRPNIWTHSDLIRARAQITLRGGGQIAHHPLIAFKLMESCPSWSPQPHGLSQGTMNAADVSPNSTGVGPIGAALLMMKTPAPEMFRSGRQFAAWISLTPKDHSTAGKVRLGVITRAGDEALRSVLVVGATAVVQQVRRGGRGSPWIVDLLKRKPPKLAAVALANKMARIAWKLMVTGNSYAAKSAPAALMGAA